MKPIKHIKAKKSSNAFEMWNIWSVSEKTDRRKGILFIFWLLDFEFYLLSIQ